MRSVAARLVVVGGLVSVTAGAWLVYRPAGLIVGGFLAAVYGLIGIDVDGRTSGKPPA